MDAMFQLALAGIVAHGIQWAKRHPEWQWIDAHKDGVAKALATGFAFLAAVGITTTLEPTGDFGTLTITGIPMTVEGWGEILKHGFEQYWGQKFYYLAAIKPNQPDDTRDPPHS